MWIDMGRHDFVANVAVSKPKAIPMFFSQKQVVFNKEPHPTGGLHGIGSTALKPGPGREQNHLTGDLIQQLVDEIHAVIQRNRNMGSNQRTLVGGWPTPLKIWKSVGMIIPNIWTNKTCSKPPNRTWCTFGDLGSLEIFRPCWTSLTARGSGKNRFVTHGPMAANDSTVTSHTQWFFRLMIIDLVCWADAVIGWAGQPANYNIYIYIHQKPQNCALLELWRSIQYLVYWWKWGMLSQFPLRQEAWHQIQHIHSHGYEPPLLFEKKRDFSNSRVWWMLHNSI